MTYCVLDASAAIAMVVRDEITAFDEALLRTVESYGASVTALWHLEVANVLLNAARRGRISVEERTAAFKILKKLMIEVDRDTTTRAWTDAMSLAEAQSLTVYDASYLELAMRTNLPLATRDKALRRAASALAVPLR